MTNGKIIDGRYEILEELGRGGMAIVYLAKCLVLNRYVAIKVLRPEYRHDEDFIKRFKIEAQSAGNLSHPNIVSIYDVGNEGDVEYIVMEYVEGITLKQYLGAKGILPEKEAVDFASQICAGLEHAHKKGIVHKDVKPENILITKEGILKITDFGIAKALNQATITTGGGALGSVHYFSPEQARGAVTDAKTDIYSVGVILYEMATGRRPFEGESAISIAMQHIESEPVRPSIINPRVSPSLDSVILRAMKKDTFERYQSATQMLIDLKKLSVGSSVNRTTPHKPPVNDDRKQPAEETARRVVDNKKNKDDNHKNDSLSVILGIVAAIILTGAIALGVYVFSTGGSSDDIATPSFLGKTYSEVMEMCDEKDYKKLKVVLDTGAPLDENIEGVVADQSPDPGKSIKNTAKIKLTFGEAPPELVSVEDVQNMTESDAIATLRAQGFKVRIDKMFSDEIPAGRVVTTTPEATSMVEAGTEVTIYVSGGEEDKYTKVPNILGKTEEEAIAILKEADLVLGNATSVDSNEEKGKIVSQSRTEGDRIEKGQTIDVEISKGPKAEDEPTPEPSPEPGSDVPQPLPESGTETQIPGTVTPVVPETSAE